MYIYIHENDIFYFKSDKHKSMTVLATNIGKEKKKI